MTASLMIPIRAKFWGTNGTPLAYGKVYTYEAGTTTDKDTYTTFEGTTANTNPVILNAYGEANIWLDGNYHIVVKDSTDTLVPGYDIDNVSSFNSSNNNYVVTTGSPNAYVATPSPAITAYSVGLRYYVQVNFTNTGPATINFSGLGAVTLVDAFGNALIAGDLLNGLIYQMIYDGTNFRVLELNVVDEFYVTTGSPNAYVLTPSPAIVAYNTGYQVYIKASFTNTGAATINISGLGTKALVYNSSTPLTGGEIVSGTIYNLLYDGTNFQVLNPTNVGINDFYVTTGSGAAYVLTPSPILGSYTEGVSYKIRASFTNTSAPTINISGLGAVSLLDENGQALNAGEIVSGNYYNIICDGTNFRVRYVDKNLIYIATTGTSNAYAIAPTPALGAYVTGTRYMIKANFTNSGACTLNVSSLGAVALTDNSGTALTANQIIADSIYFVVYDGTNFQVLNPTEVVVTPTNIFVTGDLKLNGKSTPDSGWLIFNGETLAKISGGDYNGSTYQDLYEHLWTWYADGQAPVNGGRGASATADWDANKYISMPNISDRVLAGAGGTYVSGQTFGATTGTPTGSMSGTVGSTMLSTSEIPSHQHTAFADQVNGTTLSTSNYACRERDGGTQTEDYIIDGTATAATLGLTSSTGGGGSHNHTLSGATFTGDSMSLLQPSIAFYVHVKL